MKKSYNEIYDGENSLIYQSVSVCPKTSYTLQAYGRVNSKGTCYLQLCENSGTSTICSKQVLLKNNVWAGVSKTITTGKGQVTAEIDVFAECLFVTPGHINKVYIDDIKIF
jgi:hypothetical protein